MVDIGLPELNGYDVARKIRERPWGVQIVLVALTGWGQEDDGCRSLQAGFDHHLTKPVDHASLTKLLAESPPTGGEQSPSRGSPRPKPFRRMNLKRSPK